MAPLNLSYIYIFLQSNLIEWLIYRIFYRRRLSALSSLSLTTLANSITHPIVFFVIMNEWTSYLSAILLAEAFAIVAETILHAWAGRIPVRLTAISATAANLVSWQLAPILTYFLILKR